MDFGIECSKIVATVYKTTDRISWAPEERDLANRCSARYDETKDKKRRRGLGFS
jgi:hypothetical protein